MEWELRAPEFRERRMRVDGVMERLGPARVRLTMELAAEEVQEMPADELVEALAASAVEAAQTRGLVPLRRPAIDIPDRGEAHRRGTPLRATAVVDVRPPIHLPELSTVRVEIEPLEVGAWEVDERLDAMRRDYVDMTPVDRPAEVGDIVRINLQATIDGVDVPYGRADGVIHEVGSGHLLTGLDQALIGMRPGQSTAIRTRLVGGQDAGRGADLLITVDTVADKRILDLDDEFAALVADTSIDELRAAVRTELVKARKTDRMLAARDKAFAAISALVGRLPLDEAIRDDAHAARESLLSDLRAKGQTLARFLEDKGMSEAELDASLLDSAARRLHSNLMLDIIAEEKGIDVSQDELKQVVVRLADHTHAPLRAFAEQLARTNMIFPLYVDVRRQKALVHVLRTIVITDVHGKRITFDDLQTSPT